MNYIDELNDECYELLREVHNIFVPTNGIEQDVYNQIEEHMEKREKFRNG